MRWQDSLHSDVNREYVSDPNPSLGDRVRVRLKVWKEAPLRGVDLRAILSGCSSRRPMRRIREGERFAWWEAELPIEHREMIHWHFVCHAEEGHLFYNRSGVHRFNPTEDHDWTLLPEFDGADWVKDAVFYQIFPDRFHNGDPSIGRRSGEYEYDGGCPRVMDWRDTPLEYPEGRCLDFFNGDLSGIEQKLDYLADLGITALYLNPIFCAKTTHRYDCTDYLHVDEALGGDAALARLTAAAHAKGIRVVLDVSVNHTGSEHPWYRAAHADPDAPEAAHYYPDGRGGFACWCDVPTLPQLNYRNPEVRDLVWQQERALVRHWLRPPWQIDGWRFDVGNMTGRRKSDQFGHLIWRGVRKAVKAERPDAYIVGEHWEDAISYQLGDQWDGAMNYFACGSPLRRWAGERVCIESEAPGFPARSGRACSGHELEAMIRQHLDRLPCQHVGLQMNVLDTHDIHRLHHGPAFDWDIYRGVVMLQFLLPGAPNLWYGDEVGLAGHAKSVEGCRYPMEWREDRWDQGFRELYRTLAHLKRKEPVLREGGYRFLFTEESQLAFARVGGGTAYVAVLNRAPEISRIELPLHLLGICDHAEEVFDGRRFPVVDGVLGLALAPRENLLLRFSYSE